MDLWIIRIILYAAILISGFLVRPFGPNLVLTLVFGVVFGLFILFVECRIRALSLKTVLGGAVGALLGIIGASLVSPVIGRMNFVHPEIETFVQILVLILMTYLGMLSGTSKGEFIDLASLGGIFTENALRKSCKVLDTSVIIDGRIADICETGFLEGTLVAPHFVLRELQQIADSADSAKRNRGRRGLDVLEKIVGPRGVGADRRKGFRGQGSGPQVDRAGQGNGRQDRHQRLQPQQGVAAAGVEVLNINELANALNPSSSRRDDEGVHPQGGRNTTRGGLPDDGTMVVVDNARRMIGRTISTQVTSVLQTTAGR